jgi:hypothetical protein
MWFTVLLGFSLLLVYGAVAVLQDRDVRVSEESPLVPGFDRLRTNGARSAHFNEFDGDTWNMLPLALAEPPVDWMEASDDPDVVYARHRATRIRRFSRSDSETKLNRGIHR